MHPQVAVGYTRGHLSSLQGPGLVCLVTCPYDDDDDDDDDDGGDDDDGRHHHHHHHPCLAPLYETRTCYPRLALYYTRLASPRHPDLRGAGRNGRGGPAGRGKATRPLAR